MRTTLSAVAGCAVALSAAAAFGQVAPPAAAPAAQGQSSNNLQAGVDRFERRMQQVQAQNRIQANPDIPVGQRVFLDYGAYLIGSYLSVDDSSNDNHVLRQYDLIGYAHVNVDGAHDVFFRGRTTYQDFNPDDSFDHEGSKQHGVVEQAYYRFDLQKHLGAYRGVATANDLAVQAGRQTVVWGNGLTLNQDVDGVVVDATLGQTTLELLGGVTVPDTIDFDTTRPGFDDRTTRGFFGGLLSTQVGQSRPYAYVLFQRDYNPDERLDITTPNGVAATRFDYQSIYFGVGSSGSITDKLVYGVEAVFETGSGLTNSLQVVDNSVAPANQAHEPVEAWALDGRLDYLFGDRHLTRASGEVILATGDTDRLTTSNGTVGGNRAGTRDNAFNGFGLLNTGLAFNPTISNIVILRGGLSTTPLPEVAAFRKLQVGVDAFLYQKFRAKAPIDEQTGDTRFLGWEPDAFLNWQVTSDLTFAVRYGAFFPGDKVADGNVRQFIFSGITLAF